LDFALALTHRLEESSSSNGPDIVAATRVLVLSLPLPHALPFQRRSLARQPALSLELGLWKIVSMFSATPSVLWTLEW
jgi:hypothetical protein